MTTRPYRLVLPEGAAPRLLSRERAAKYLGISPCHFDAHVEVKPLRLGRRKLWDRGALDRWVDSRNGTQSDTRSLDEWIGGLGGERNDEN